MIPATQREDCDACAAAVDQPMCGRLYTSCRGCMARYVSRQPKGKRQAFYRDALERHPQEDVEAFRGEVQACAKARGGYV